MNKFNTASSTLATLSNLVARAESAFGDDSRVIGVHTYTYSLTVSVQMHEADLLAWCAERGLTPTSKTVETDYRAFGGGFTTDRRHEVVVEGVPELGLLLLTSSTMVSRRPAHPVTENEEVAVA